MSGKIWAMVLFFCIAQLSLAAADCAGGAGISPDKYEINAVKGQDYFFTFVVYNYAGCPPANYSIDLELKNAPAGKSLNDLFEWSTDEKEFSVDAPGSKKILLTIKPLIEEGIYEIHVIATASTNTNESGTSVSSSAISKIWFYFGDETKKQGETEKPEWYNSSENEGVGTKQEKNAGAESGEGTASTKLAGEGNAEGVEKTGLLPLVSLEGFPWQQVLFGLVVVSAIAFFVLRKKKKKEGLAGIE